jgi:hypothetical protein
MIATMLSDVALAAALGLPRSTWWSRLALNAGLQVRNAIRRRTPLGTVPSFVPGQAAPPIYAQGYDLADIGPLNVMGPGTATPD